jgi:4'-phosphopantetheinyl transferase EntD
VSQPQGMAAAAPVHSRLAASVAGWSDWLAACWQPSPVDVARLERPGIRSPGIACLRIVDVAAMLEQVDVERVLPETRSFAPRRRAAFIAGRLCAERALARAGIAFGESIAQDAAGAPIWPAEARGTISHDDECALAIVSADHHLWVGVDLELIASAGGLEAVVSLCLLPQEAVRVTCDERGSILATLFFSAKESYYKAVYPFVKRYVEFTEVVIEVDDRLATFVGRPVACEASPDLPVLQGGFAILGHRVVTWVLSPGGDPGIVATRLALER